jgi:hypothetical protein
MHPNLYRSIVWVRALADAVERRGFAREEIFGETDIASNILGDSRARISLDDWDALVERALILTGDPGLGITIAATKSDHLHHILGPITVACGSLRESAIMFQRYVSLLGNT